MAHNITKKGIFVDIDGTYSEPISTMRLRKMDNHVELSFAQLNQTPIKLDTTIEINGETYATIDDIYDALASFSYGGGDGQGVTKQDLDDKFGRNFVFDEPIDINTNGYYSYIGQTDIVQPLPELEGNTGMEVIIFNVGPQGMITVTGDIHESSPTESLQIMAGENYTFYNNSLHWMIKK